MSAAEIKELKKDKLIDAMGLTRRIIRILEEVRNIIRDPEITVSGGLVIKERKGGKCLVAWRGVADFTEQFDGGRR